MFSACFWLLRFCLFCNLWISFKNDLKLHLLFTDELIYCATYLYPETYRKMVFWLYHFESFVFQIVVTGIFYVP